VKVASQEETGLIQQHRINAHDETTALVVLTRQMPANHLVGYGKKTLVGAVGTFDPRFEYTQGEILRFAQNDSSDEFFRSPTAWRIAGPASLSAFETARIDIFPSVKQGAEEGDFRVGWGTLVHASSLQRG